MSKNEWSIGWQSGLKQLRHVGARGVGRNAIAACQRVRARSRRRSFKYHRYSYLGCSRRRAAVHSLRLD